MRWTDTPPTQPGWYWYRYKTGAMFAQAGPAQPTYAHPDARSGRLVADVSLLADGKVEWSDVQIPTPEEEHPVGKALVDQLIKEGHALCPRCKGTGQEYTPPDLHLGVCKQCAGAGRADAWPPLKPGTRVRTTQRNGTEEYEKRNWAESARGARKWGVKGTVGEHHTGHGLCYTVVHDDGTTGWYDPEELEKQ